jgi:hypothetical protein
VPRCGGLPDRAISDEVVAETTIDIDGGALLASHLTRLVALATGRTDNDLHDERPTVDPG